MISPPSNQTSSPNAVRNASAPHSAEFYEREYNPRNAVPELPQILERWAADGAQARATLDVQVDLVYGQHPRQRLDYFPAIKSGQGRRPPLLVFIHGGYWRVCDKSDFSWLAAGPLQLGAAVAIVNYGLLPTTPLREIVQHLREAHAWLFQRGDELGFDNQRMVTVGHSAGGHLTAMMLATPWGEINNDLPADLVKGGMAISGLFDLEPLLYAPFIQNDLRLTSEEAAELSPALLSPKTRAGLITAVGEHESAEFKRQSSLMADRWPDNYRSHLTIPGTHHYDVFNGLAKKDSALSMAVADLLGLRQG